jgi:hypothetical protein
MYIWEQDKSPPNRSPCRWFSPGTLVSSTNKTDLHDIIEILLKVALTTISHKPEVEHTNYVDRSSRIEIAQGYIHHADLTFVVDFLLQMLSPGPSFQIKNKIVNVVVYF